MRPAVPPDEPEREETGQGVEHGSGQTREFGKNKEIRPFAPRLWAAGTARKSKARGASKSTVTVFPGPQEPPLPSASEVQPGRCQLSFPGSRAAAGGWYLSPGRVLGCSQRPSVKPEMNLRAAGAISSRQPRPGVPERCPHGSYTGSRCEATALTGAFPTGSFLVPLPLTMCSREGGFSPSGVPLLRASSR